MRGTPLDAPIRPKGDLTRIAVRVPALVVATLKNSGLGIATAARNILVAYCEGTLGKK